MTFIELFFKVEKREKLLIVDIEGPANEREVVYLEKNEWQAIVELIKYYKGDARDWSMDDVQFIKNKEREILLKWGCV